jgi:hypothetical protein
LKTRQEIKEKQEDQEKRAQVKKNESDKPHHLEFIHPTSQTKPKNILKLFLLSV